MRASIPAAVHSNFIEIVAFSGLYWAIIDLSLKGQMHVGHESFFCLNMKSLKTDLLSFEVIAVCKTEKLIQYRFQLYNIRSCLSKDRGLQTLVPVSIRTLNAEGPGGGEGGVGTQQSCK